MKIKEKLKRKLSKFVGIRQLSEEIEDKSQDLKMLIGKYLSNTVKLSNNITNIKDAEFKVFSQFGDDGIIQYLINSIEIKANEKTFIEFGVENYKESNTRFLLTNNNWKGLVIDSAEQNIDYIKKDKIYFYHDLTAICSFVTKENINDIFLQNHFNGPVGILSIDIDGNDYWIWEAITAVNPVIVIVEYNSVYGSENAITIPYDSTFSRFAAHYSGLYFGTSLKALDLLAKKNGYVFVGCNSNGNNAYFVKNDRINSVQPISLAEGYVESKFRESRDKEGNFTFISGKDRLRQIQEMPVFDLEKQEVVIIKDLL